MHVGGIKRLLGWLDLYDLDLLCLQKLNICVSVLKLKVRGMSGKSCNMFFISLTVWVTVTKVYIFKQIMQFCIAITSFWPKDAFRELDIRLMISLVESSKNFGFVGPRAMKTSYCKSFILQIITFIFCHNKKNIYLDSTYIKLSFT